MKKLLFCLLLISTITFAQKSDSTIYRQKYKDRANMGIGFTSLGATLITLGLVLHEPRDNGKTQPGMFLYFGAPAAAFGIYSLFSAISPYKKYKLAKSNKTALYFEPTTLSLTYKF